MISVGQIEEPKEIHLSGAASLFLPADCSVKSVPSQLGFAAAIDSHIGAIVVEQIEQRRDDLIGLIERLRGDESHTVRRGVIFREGTVYATHQAAHRQVKTRRTKLSFVVTIWVERHDFVLMTGMTQD